MRAWQPLEVCTNHNNLFAHGGLIACWRDPLLVQGLSQTFLSKPQQATRSDGLTPQTPKRTHASRVAICQGDAPLVCHVGNEPIIIENEYFSTIPNCDGIQAWLNRQVATATDYHTLLPAGSSHTADEHYRARRCKEDGV